MDTIKRVIMIILDSVGVGELPDAKLFGDVGSNTLAHIGEITGGLNLPNMGKLGLGNIINIKGVSRIDHPNGFPKSTIEEFDGYIPEIIENMKDSDLLIISADHGCDPTFKGTDHTREYIPILAYSKDIKSGNIGTRESFSDIADTIKKLLIGKESKYSFIK